MPTGLTCNEPLVSVLVPIYNSAPYLKECIDSILHQSYNNLQIILLDDGSTDGSPDICEQYEIVDSRIEIHRTPHSGIAAARNQLIGLANGKYSIFVDSDDYYSNNYVIEKLLRYNEDYFLDASVFDINGSGAVALCEILTKEDALGIFLRENRISSSVCAKLVKTEIYRKLYFDSEIVCGEDLLMTWRILNNINQIGLISGKFYHYRNNLNSITNGGFNDNTYSLHKVWDKIIDNCTTLNYGLLKFAMVKQTNCYERLLLSAVNSNIYNDARIQKIRTFLKKNIRIVLNSRQSFFWRISVVFCVYMYDTVRLVAHFCNTQMNLIR